MSRRRVVGAGLSRLFLRRGSARGLTRTLAMATGASVVVAGLSVLPAAAAPSAASGPAFPSAAQDKLVGAPSPVRVGGPVVPAAPVKAKPEAVVVTPPRPGSGVVGVGSSFARAGGLPVRVASAAAGAPILAGRASADGKAVAAPPVRATAGKVPGAVSDADKAASVKLAERKAADEKARRQKASTTSKEPGFGATGKAGWQRPWTPPASASASTPAAAPSAPSSGTASAVASVAVETLDPAVVNGLGGRFLGFTVRRTDGGSSSGAVSVQVDYSSIAKAFGGGFAGRVSLVRYPACVLTTPKEAACATGMPVDATADPVTSTLTAVVLADPATAGSSGVVQHDERASRGYARTRLAGRALAAPAAAAAGAAVYALSSSSSSPAGGTFTATPLKASDSWVVGEQSGGFAYSYALPAVPATSGATPSFALSYDSGSVDGLTSHENNQSSPVGLGWQMQVPYLEQRFTPCTNSGIVGHQCWAGGRTTLSMNGRLSGLVDTGVTYDGSIERDQLRMMEDDPGWRIERVFAGTSANPNGDGGGVYWKVTTNDGAQYYFGRENADLSTAPNNSTLTQPMFAQSSNDVCWGNSGHECSMAWRWNLAYVVDQKGNLQSYQWEKARYSYQPSGGSVRHYDGAGYLTSVTYGNTTSNAKTAQAPQRIDFSYGWRCDFAGCRAPVPHDNYAANYPDSPLDQWCADTASSCSQGPTSPVYFFLKKLESVTATVSTGSGYRPVERVSLDAGYPRWQGNLWSAVLWLRTLTRTGFAPDGTSQALPAVYFGEGTEPWPANRWDATPVSGWYQNKPRITDITTELGGRAHVTYGQPNACDSQQLDGNEDWQTTDCFPSREPDGHQAWFRRYLVTKLEVIDRFGAPTQTTTYDYDTDGGAAWHSDNDPVTPRDQQSWSDYRGYRGLTVREGTPGGQVTTTEKRFFRGMAGDHTKGNNGYDTKWAQVQTAWSSDSETSERTFDDYHEYSGKPLEERVLLGDGTEISATQHEYDLHIIKVGEEGQFGIYQHNADFTWELRNLELTRADGVDRKWKKSVYHAVDPDYGLPVATQDDGDPIRGTGPTCAYTTYTQNLDKHIIDTEKTEVTATGYCPASGTVPPAATDLIDRTDTYYDDNFTALDAAPTAGLPTKVVKWASSRGTGDPSTSTTATKYDALGRVIGMISPDNFVAGATSFDTAGPASTTTYTTSGGVVTGRTVTNPAGHVTTQVFEPGRRLPLTTTDRNGKVTTAAYDPLGRLTAVRLPGDDYDSKTVSYTVSNSAPSTVVTSQYPAKGAAPVQEWQFYDSLGRIYQDETAGPKQGTVVTGSRFDDRGNRTAVVAATASTATPGTPFGQWYDPTFTATLPSQTITTYDEVNRPVRVALTSSGTARQVTTTSYDGTTTTTTPPSNSGADEPDLGPTRQTTDLSGNVVSRTVGVGTSVEATTTFQFDVAGHQIQARSPLGARTTASYDWLGRRTSVVDPDAGTTTTEYYPSGVARHSRDGAGVETFTALDVLSRATGTFLGSSSSGTPVAQTVYDGVPLGATAAVKGTITSRTIYDSGNAYTERYGYDDRYRTTRTDRVVPAVQGSPIQYLAGTYTATTAYDGLDRVTGTTYPAGGGLASETVSTAWTGAYATRLTSPLATYVDSTDYTATGQLGGQVLGTSGAVGSVGRSYAYDPATRRVTTEAAASPSTSSTANVQSDSYTYTPLGDVTKITDATSGQQQCFGYDVLDRLASAATSAVAGRSGTACTPDSTGPQPYAQSFTYDADGDITGLTSGGTVTTFGYGADGTTTGGPHAPTKVTTGGLTTRYGYDPAGRLSQVTPGRSGGARTTYAWNGLKRLASVSEEGGAATSFVEGPGGRWVRQTAAETVLYLPGQELHLAAGRTAASDVVAVRAYAQGERTVAVRTTGQNGGLFWLLSDRQGSVTVAVNSTTGQVGRQRYLPYGSPRDTASTLPTERGWIGQTGDRETGLAYLNARYYDPATLHFLSTDPLTDQSAPQRANPYGYGADNPLTYADPTGEYVVKPGDNWYTIAALQGISNPSANNWASVRAIFGSDLSALSIGRYIYVPAVDGGTRTTTVQQTANGGLIGRLPTSGSIPFEPKKGQRLSDPKSITRSSGNPVDKYGDEWVWDPIKGEWDVQTGRDHTNVSPSGEITHGPNNTGRAPKPAPKKEDDDTAKRVAGGTAVVVGGVGLGTLLWWLGKGASPLCGPAVLVCAVAL